MRFSRALLITAGFVLSTRLLQAELANGIKAIVNDTIITYQQVERLAAPAVDVLRNQYGRQPELFERKASEAFNSALEQLIERQLILADFKSAGYSIPENVIDDSIQERIRERFGDRASLTKNLQAEGMTYEKYRQQVREQIIVEALSRKNVSSEVFVSPFKIQQYYNEHQDEFKLEDQVHLRMIVLTNASDAEVESGRRLAREILGKINEGATLAEMASIYSTGSQKNEGGDWGWVERAVLRKELAEVAFTLKPGQHSDVIETPGAIYIMKVEEVKPAHVKPLADVQDQIEKTLQLQERNRLYKEWIARLRTKTFVRYF